VAVVAREIEVRHEIVAMLSEQDSCECLASPTLQELFQTVDGVPPAIVVVDGQDLACCDIEFLRGAMLFQNFRVRILAQQPLSSLPASDRVSYDSNIEDLVINFGTLHGGSIDRRPGSEPSEGVPRALTAREFEIASYLRRGYTNRQIAEITNVKELRIRNIVQDILRKLRCPSRHNVGDYLAKYPDSSNE
jgi:DNA-binding CsgD family transcriptional regulator